MIDYTKLSYTERLLYVGLLERQRKAAAESSILPGESTIQPGAAPAPAGGGTALPGHPPPGSRSLEKLLLYGLLVAGAGLLAYGLYQHLYVPAPKPPRRQDEH